MPIVEVHLSRYFTVVELQSGSVGACMSSFYLSDLVLGAIENAVMQELGEDAFGVLDRGLVSVLLDTTVEDAPQRAAVGAAIMSAITSALSAPVIRRGGDAVFCVSQTFPGFTYGVRTALVVGYGGYFQQLVELPSIRCVHIADLSYERRRQEIDCEIGRYAMRFPDKRITVSGAIQTSDLRDYETICITGSTLGNGTLDGILSAVHGHAEVVLQGQSASIHPIKLFEAGVKWVATTVKPPSLSALARNAYDGSTYRPLLEGRLPWLYILPRP